MNYTHRYVLRAVIEFTEPFIISAGRGEKLADMEFVADANGLPVIPGTSIAGVLRSAFRELYKDEADELFGYQSGSDGLGSKLRISCGYIHDKTGTPVEGIVPQSRLYDDVLANARSVAIRDHVRLSHKGTADDRGKFDVKPVCAGNRFTFELELSGDERDAILWNHLIETLSHASLKFGGSTTRGYGSCRIVDLKSRCFDLRSDFEAYRSHPVSLAMKSPVLNDVELPLKGEGHIRIELEANGYWMFGGGEDLQDEPGQDDDSNGADMAPVRDNLVIWNDGVGKVKENVPIIPGSGLKGALAHRTAFLYNAQKKFFADGLTEAEIAARCGEHNEAVRELFGWPKGLDGKEDLGHRGRVSVGTVYMTGD